MGLSEKPELAFISMPLRAESVDGYLTNLDNARWVTKMIMGLGYIPITPHLQYLGVLDVNDKTHDSLAIALCKNTLLNVNTAFFCIPADRIHVNHDGSIDTSKSFSAGMENEWNFILGNAGENVAVSFSLLHRKPLNAFVLIRVEYRVNNKQFHKRSEANLAIFEKRLTEAEDREFQDEESIETSMPKGTSAPSREARDAEVFEWVVTPTPGSSGFSGWSSATTTTSASTWTGVSGPSPQRGPF